MKPLFTFSPQLILILFLLINPSNRIFAQSEKPSVHHWFAIGLNTGVKSIAGLDLGMVISPSFNIRAGYQYANLNYYNPGFYVEASSKSYDVEAEYRFSHIELFGEYHVFRFMRLVVGAGIFLDNTASLYATPGEDSQFNDIVLTPEEIGYVKGTSQYASPVAPYFGLAFGKLVPKKRVGISCDIGTFYKGSPTVDVEASELLSENTRNEEILNRNLKSYQWFPNLSLRIAVRLNK